MASPRIFSRSIYSIVLIAILVSAATAHHDETESMTGIPRLARSPDTDKMTATTMRFLRSGDINAANNEIVNSEERGYIGDKFAKLIFNKVSLKLALTLEIEPFELLKLMRQKNLPMNENYLLSWLRYVQKYRARTGTVWADDAQVVEQLKKVIPGNDLSHFFKAMEMKPKLRKFAKDLQKVAANAA
ncbi:RxLR effector protein [Phytophthora megakarya]|uniref:RxLR effector protein n=1 Tax=Phytophthora megakarya TaxID=4795 RepID=A0A225VG83_9STRA|nr:RxLR effector protein [Phytophthora megakarya]